MSDDPDAIHLSEEPGCRFHEHAGTAPCNKVCDPGETFCPHHLLLATTRPADGPTAERMRQATKTPRAYQE